MLGPTLSDDAHIYAWLARAALAGEGFPNPTDTPVLGVSELLYLHLVTALQALGIAPLASVWVANAFALGLLGAVMWRWRGWWGALLALGAIFLSQALLVGAGGGLFLALAVAASAAFGAARSGVWAGLAAAARPEALLPLAVAAGCRGRRGLAWLAWAALPLAAVALATYLLWGTPGPATLGARQALLERLVIGGGQPPALSGWAVGPALLLLLPGWRPGERRLLWIAALMGLGWWVLGADSGAAFFLVGGLCWLAAAARAARSTPWAKAALLALGLASTPLALRNEARWQDHHEVARTIAASLPAEGCTLAYWYLGYLRTHTAACLLDGSGVFDLENLREMERAGTGDILVHTRSGDLAAVLHFQAPGSDVLQAFLGMPATVRVEGRTLAATLYERPPPPPEPLAP